MKISAPSGFTLIEIMIGITIVSILASMAVPNYVDYRKRAYNTTAKQDAKNVYVASQTYFNDYPKAAFSSVTPLYAYGFRQASHVTVLVAGSQSALTIDCYHANGDKTFSVDSEGNIF